MKSRTWLCAGTLLAVTLVLADAVISQQGGPGGSEPESSSASTESLVDTWVRFAMPGEHHRLLEKMAGRWNMHVKYRMDAGEPVVESRGSCHRKWILGNRFLLEEFDGGSLALPFQGLAIYGYDAFEKKYTSVWLDTMSTAMTTNRGVCRNGCDLIEFTGRHGDAWTGTMRASRGLTKFVDDKRHVLELYEPGRNGEEFRILEIIYTRP
jgi:hypothetical protein